MHLEFRDNHLGFSLIEMLAILAIIGILCLSATQSTLKGFNRIQAWMNLNSFCTSWIQSVHFARNQAISQQTFVTIMPAFENNWQSGWVVYSNPELRFTEEIFTENILLNQTATNNTLIKTAYSQSGNGFEDISLRINSSNEKLRHITFNPAGGAQMKNGGLIANRIVFQHTEFEDIEQHILMGAGGRIRLCTPSNENLQCRR